MYAVVEALCSGLPCAAAPLMSAGGATANLAEELKSRSAESGGRRPERAGERQRAWTPIISLPLESILALGRRLEGSISVGSSPVPVR